MTIKSRKNVIIIFTGPSGVGKGTIEKYLFANPELRLTLSCSATTRQPRVNEIDGIHYFFISKECFKQKINNHEFLEYSFHFDNFYGTLYDEIDRIHNANRIPFLEIETFGAKQILNNADVHKKYKVLTFFIMPPNIEELKNRILNRNTENADSVEKRMQKAIDEMKDANLFEHIITNNDALEAANEITNIIKKEIN
ncbi:guanylate kinase [Mycoplasmopsis primatum]|uniref:guanylate kinase n=1 Tax=Mycoplasmopsis primatum TaxID=55604 RepID=UPI000495C5B1|nr:guanylate kinase [Mycoplasmopsis primatum]